MKAAVRTIVSAILLVAILLCGLLLPAGTALADATPIILLSGKATDTDITVEVNLRGNEGISSMLLSLDYDRERLVLVGMEQGDALSTLDIVTTNVEGEAGYAVYPFVISWMGDANDNTNGKLLTLHFATVGAETQGKAYVTFTYQRDRDVNYIDEGDLKTRNLLVDTLHVDLSRGKATEMTNEVRADDLAPKKDATALAVGLSLGGAAVVALAIGLPLLWRKKNK